MKKLIVLTLSCLLILQSKAYHIVGGEIYYDCLGGNDYLITLKVYRDCYSGGADFDDPLFLGVFTEFGNLYETLELDFPGATLIDPELSNPCMLNPPDVCVEEAIYTVIVNLPANGYGYDIVYQRCCRNSTIVNLDVPDEQGATYLTHIPDPGDICNSSPRFNNFPPLVICAGYPFNFDHSATDPDGDSLSYELCAPFLGASYLDPAPVVPSPPPYTNVNYEFGYDATYPMDASPPLTIFPATGWMEGTPAAIGQYVVGVCVKEYRDGALIGVHYRDFQFNVTDCTPGLYADFPDEYNNCDNWTISFDNSSFGATTWFWDFGDPSTDADTSDIFSPSYVYPDTGTYTVMLVAKPYTLCADTAYSNVQIYPGLIANYAWETDCAWQPVAFNDVSVSTYGYLEQWDWNFGDGATSNAQDPEHVYTESGIYDVQLSIKNIYGCTKTVSHEVLVYPLPEVTFMYDNACLQQYSLLSEAVTIDSAYSIVSLEWILPDGSSASGNIADYFMDTAGAYPVTLIATSNVGCIDSVTDYVVVRPPVIADVYTDTTICAGDTMQLYTKNGMYYQWFPNYNISDILDHDPFVYPEITTEYRVIISDDCTSDTAYVTISVLPTPEAEAWPDTAVYRYEPVELTATGGVSYSWSPGENMDNPTSAEPVLSPYETETYVVTVTGENGCISTDTISVVVWLRCEQFTIPSAFSPNGDGINDAFRIVSTGDDAVNQYQIFNRWGTCVFSAGSIDETWDGTFEGKAQETGVYMYLISVECEDYSETLSGTITLLN